MDDAVVSIDEEGNIIIVNNKAELLLGIRKADYMSKKIDEVIEDTELLRIVETASEEINMPFKYGNKVFLVDRIPVTHQGKIKGAIAIFHDSTGIEEMRKQLEDDKMYIDTLDTIMDSWSEQIVLIDEKGIVKLMSDSYKEFLGIEDPEGKHVKDVIENTRLHIVLETGESEVGDIQIINGNKTIATRIPIKKQGKIVGAIGKVMFKDISELNKLTKKSAVLEKEMNFDGALEKERTAKYSFKSLIGHSQAINKAKNLARKVAKTDSNVLITGESGTGKEVFVHAIHNASVRRNSPFIKINCAAIPRELLESELFGYEEGAFTGAKKGGKVGKVQLAHGGTLLLDEIGDMPLEMQAKLLRVIQDKEVEKIGGEVSQNVDVRIMASTNKNLASMVEHKEFRQDLYYRLNVMNIKLPSLKDRIEDVPQLAREFCFIIGNRLGMHVDSIADEVIDIFMNYRWPGNIRELENVIERAINLLDSDSIIKAEHLPDHMGGSIHRLPNTLLDLKDNQSTKDMNLKRRIETMEEEIIGECLISVNHNKNKAAKILNISRVSLYKKIEKYGL